MRERLSVNAQAVLEIVKEATNHPTALDVFEAVKQKRPRIGLASVYRILHQLAEQGYIRELGRNEDGSRYDGRTTRHDHAICVDCGALLDVPVAVSVPQEVLQAAAQSLGIEVSSYEVRLYGHCPSCLAPTKK